MFWWKAFVSTVIWAWGWGRDTESGRWGSLEKGCGMTNVGVVFSMVKQKSWLGASEMTLYGRCLAKKKKKSHGRDSNPKHKLQEFQKNLKKLQG